MELGKIAPVVADPATTRVGTEAGTAPASPGALGGSSAELPDAAVAALLADAVNIHPLDVAGALQILIAEVRASLTLPGDVRGGAGLPPGDLPPAPAGTAPPAPGDAVRAELALLEVAVRGEYSALAGTALQSGTATPATAPLVLVQMLLQHLPEEEDPAPAAWLAAATQAEAALRSGLDKAVDAVLAWRNVPPRVADVARDTRDVVLAALGDDPPSPLWLRPEWLGLAPRMERFWRRRRLARRRLRDPDFFGQVSEHYEPPGERES